MNTHRKKYKLLHFSLMLLIAIITGRQTASASDTCEAVTNERVVQIAQAGFEAWKSAIQSQQFALGNPVASDLSLAQAFRVYTVSADSLRNYNGGTSLFSALSAEDTWDIVVLANGKALSLLQVNCVQGDLSIVGVESAVTASKLNTLAQALEKTTVTLRLVKINPLHRIFLLTEQNSSAVVYPLIEFSGQYGNAPVNQDGGYNAYITFLLIAAELLKTANAVTIDATMGLHIPCAINLNASSTGIQTLHATLKSLPNNENRLLFELTDYGLNQ